MTEKLSGIDQSRNAAIQNAHAEMETAYLACVDVELRQKAAIEAANQANAAVHVLGNKLVDARNVYNDAITKWTEAVRR